MYLALKGGYLLLWPIIKCAQIGVIKSLASGCKLISSDFRENALLNVQLGICFNLNQNVAYMLTL